METALFHNRERDLYIEINTERIHTESLNRELFDWAFDKFASEIDMYNKAEVEFVTDNKLYIWGDDNFIVFKKIESPNLSEKFL